MATNTPSNGSAPQTEPAAATEYYPVYYAGPVDATPEQYCLWVECWEPCMFTTLAGVLYANKHCRNLYLREGGEIKRIRQIGWARRGDLSRMEDVYDRVKPFRACCFAATLYDEGLLLPLDPEDETRAAVSPAEDKE